MLSKQNLITTLQLQKKIDAKIKAIQEKSLQNKLYKQLYNKLATEEAKKVYTFDKDMLKIL